MGLLNMVGRILAGRQRGPGPDTTSMAHLLLAQAGGLEGLLRRFQQSGLGAVFGSWVGVGQNKPITPTQIQQALGSGQLVQLASRLGLDPRQLARLLAQYLPGIVDSMTPDGRLPGTGAAKPSGAAQKGDSTRH
ncbi:MAG: hypothetical protein K0R03_1756 [Moraxellaceae bacterium]|jgi:uncharacterized protein YidB (DUF937 family)|nr:hypothetical protein [Moraxellaceae bacterium]